MNETPSPETVLAAKQQQFLEVVDRDTAEHLFHSHLALEPLGIEDIALNQALGRVLASDITSDFDVPGFDRSNVDGFAVQAADTFGAMEEQPRQLALNDEVLVPGVRASSDVTPGSATTIATGAVVPRGADAVVMVEHTRVDEHGRLLVEQPATPGSRITFAGTDIARGETVLRRGQLLTSREIGVLAAIGRATIEVFRRPSVAIISTGDEIIPPGAEMTYGGVYDSNAAIIAAAVEELGGHAEVLGCFGDDEQELSEAVHAALAHDIVVLSGGTSKGAGDLSYQVVARLPKPGIVAHGVALKPGKPICLAVTGTIPIVILPGFPTSAVFTFHEFVAPVIRRLAGRPLADLPTISARLPMRVNSQRGRTEYVLTNLAPGEDGLAAYPMGKGSGSVTTFSAADGFLSIPSQTEFLEAGAEVDIQLLGRELTPADLVVIGSHCIGLDLLLGELQSQGFSTKSLYVGSSGGLAAASRGECDCGGIHLLDPETGQYNRPFLTDEMLLVPGYQRMQGLVFRRDDGRFKQDNWELTLRAVLDNNELRMVNRNAGSGTRVVIDRLLDGATPPGFAMQVRSHNAVAAAIAQERADWGIGIAPVAGMYDLGFLPIQPEQFDLVVPMTRSDRPAVLALQALLENERIHTKLAALGFERGS
ncbi:MAG TPA: molybdopterin biosynthesis protein [Planctomycetaceae bacterium]|nr:molybdopterin biosynthesis protein [Planctomycetaceae bacterium]